MPAYAWADLLQGQKMPVEIDELSNVLRELGHQAGERRSELNLLALAADVHLAEQVLEAVAEFAVPHPHRALIVFADAEAETAETAAYLSLQTLPGTQTVCSEQITLRARGAQALQGLPQKIWPLLISAQPILFWSVQGLPENSPLIDRLQKTSALLVFDSALAPELGITLARANELLHDWQAGTLADLNWLRLAPWREALAQALAHEQFRDQANAVTKIEIVLGGGILDEARLGQAALLVSWLAAQAGWDLLDSLAHQQNAFRATWGRQGREITYELRVNNESAPEIFSFQLQAQNAEGLKTLSLLRIPEPAALKCSVAAGGNETHGLFEKSLPAFSLAQLLAQAFERKNRDAEYEQVLRLATKLV